MNKVIFDTNIWVSYFIKGKFDELVNLVIDDEMIVYSSKELIEELTEVLSRKKFSKYLSLPINEYIDFHKELVTIINTKPNYKDSPDPKDNFLFDLAIQSASKYIVTGDKILLALSEVEKVRLISLSAFKQLF